MNNKFISYTPAFKPSVIEIFYSNTPRYFNVGDIDSLTFFLDNQADSNYLMVLKDEEVVGCGGYYVKQDQKYYGLAWVMFKRFSLGASAFIKLSTLFFDELIYRIKHEALPYDIVINTTQLMENNFKKFGFTTQEKLVNGFGPGLDHLVMKNKYLSHQ